ncbi:hypothetical protein [Nocardia arthritidis]|uniref:hypothetical protein n=1 Tax=Nocardia arthritidis TaxID=228602 RepID=UPI0007A3851F|nr:hypothetical protein [Nocardia arthritidis]
MGPNTTAHEVPAARAFRWLMAVGALLAAVALLLLSLLPLVPSEAAAMTALHLALLSFAVSAVALGWSTRSGLLGRVVGLSAAMVFVAGSFPWLIPNWGNSAVAVLLGAWGVSLALNGSTYTGDSTNSGR